MNYKRYRKKTGEGHLEVKVQYRRETVTRDLDKGVSSPGTNRWKRKIYQFNRVPLLS